MAEHDPIASPTPALPLKNKPSAHAGRPTVAELKTLLQTANAGYFTDLRIRQMTYNDLVYEARERSLISK